MHVRVNVLLPHTLAPCGVCSVSCQKLYRLYRSKVHVMYMCTDTLKGLCRQSQDTQTQKRQRDGREESLGKVEIEHVILEPSSR